MIADYIFPIFALNTDCWCLLEKPQGDNSNKYPKYVLEPKQEK